MYLLSKLREFRTLGFLQVLHWRLRKWEDRKWLTNADVTSEKTASFERVKLQQRHLEIYRQRRSVSNVLSFLTVKVMFKMFFYKVLHAVGPVLSHYSRPEKCISHLYKTFINCLTFANAKQFTSIAIPAISSGRNVQTSLFKL